MAIQSVKQFDIYFALFKDTHYTKKLKTKTLNFEMRIYTS